MWFEKHISLACYVLEWTLPRFNNGCSNVEVVEVPKWIDEIQAADRQFGIEMPGLHYWLPSFADSQMLVVSIWWTYDYH